MLKKKKLYLKEADAQVVTPQDVTTWSNQLVDDWISDLKKEIMTGASTSGRGLWDRFKNWLSNVWYGYGDPRNPYYDINRFGYGLGSKPVDSSSKKEKPSLLPKDFGKRESNTSLNNYKTLRETCESLEKSLNEEEQSNLRLMQIIDKHAVILKEKIKQMLLKQLEAEKQKFKMPDLCYQLSPEEKQKICASASKEAPSAAAEEKPAAAAAEEKPLKKKPKTKVSSEEGKKPVEFSFTTPPTENKEWKDLSQEEKILWNKYGGGLSKRSERVGSLAALHGVSYPQILRLGDPRADILKRILPQQKNKLKSAYDHLADHGRVELQSDPIRSQQDLEARIKKLHKEPERTSAPTEIPTGNKKSEKRIINMKLINAVMSELSENNLLDEAITDIYNRLPDSYDEFEDKIKKLVITGVASLPERFKSVFEERLTKVENFRQLANLLVSILKKHYEEE